MDWPTARWGFYCPHQEHDGRPKSHPLGQAPATRAFFRSEEVEAGHLIPPSQGPTTDPTLTARIPERGTSEELPIVGS